jgi:hypothetical protein
MRDSEGIRVEIVTATFVASGRPEGVRDLGRFLENLNNPAISRYIELAGATVRPLYRAASPAPLGATLLARRDEVIFATFEGPFVAHDAVRPPSLESVCLLLAPPFQIQGTVGFPPGVVLPQALRSLAGTFFIARDARVYDAEGYLLGEGEQIIVNGGAVQMAAPTKRRIEAFAERAGAERRAVRLVVEEPEAIQEAKVRAA